MKVYIAGPISVGDLETNVKNATEAARELIKHGFAPLCPQLSCYMAGSTPCAGAGFDHATWLEVDLPWVGVADVVLRLPGESVGADREVAEARRLGVEVWHSGGNPATSAENLADMRDSGALFSRSTAPRSQGPGGSPEFHAILQRLAELHAKKAADYGGDGDPFANVRASESAGVEPWRAAWVRALDKVHRINRYCQTGGLENEGVEDSFLDLASYSIIALLLHGERFNHAGE